MARKTITYKVMTNDRDNGKTFVITEMDAERAEEWAMRAILALMANEVQIPDGMLNMGMAAMAEVGLKALSGLKWEVAKPLIDEMFECVKFMPEPKNTHIVRDIFKGDIEEVETRVKLRLEVWKLHVNFSKAADSLEPDLTAVDQAGSQVTKTYRPQ